MTSDTLILYTNPMSRGRVVRWTLEEIGCPYETKIIEYGLTMKAPEYLAINPMGKVPALKHGEAIVTETAAICAYLADTFPQAGLIPPAADHAARAAYYRWLFFASGPMEAAVTNKIIGAEIPADKKGFVGYGSFEEAMTVLAAALKEKSFIAGNRFTTADLLISAYLGFYMMANIIPAVAVFEQYVQMHKSRPASQRANQIDDALMEQKAAN